MATLNRKYAALPDLVSSLKAFIRRKTLFLLTERPGLGARHLRDTRID